MELLPRKCNSGNLASIPTQLLNAEIAMTHLLTERMEDLASRAS